MFDTVINMKELNMKRMELLQSGEFTKEEINREYDRVKELLKASLKIGEDEENKVKLVKKKLTYINTDEVIEPINIVQNELPLDIGYCNADSPTLEITILPSGKICYSKNF